MTWLDDYGDNDIKPSLPAIINQAIIFPSGTYSSNYTAGLSKELEELSTKRLSNLKNTALYKLLKVDEIKENYTTNNDNLLEVCYLNHEQKQAVINALNNDATIITSPPGTGKSQVITNLLINAAFQKKKILFASKNNKAVDVVEQRVNQLAERPILLRQESNRYISKLEEFISKLLSPKANEKDKLQYDKYKQQYLSAIASDIAINKTINEIIEARNKLDKHEQQVEGFRKSNKRLFNKSRKIDIEELCTLFNALNEYVFLMDIDSHSIFYRIKWYLLKIKITKRFNQYIQEMHAFCKKLGIVFEFEYRFFKKQHINYYQNKLQEINNCLDNIKATQEYFYLLKEVKAFPPLPELYQKQEDAYETKVHASKKLWRLYLKLQSDNISADKRKDIANVLSDIKYIISSNKYTVPYQKLLAISEFLPCWAVTSLSARGKIPFQACFFDYIVFDEASQCDIASALPLLYRAKNVIIVGDPKQLSHIANLNNDDDRKLMRKYGIDHNSRFSYTTSSLYNITSVIKGNTIELKNHYRCHPDIIGFSN